MDRHTHCFEIVRPVTPSLVLGMALAAVLALVGRPALATTLAVGDTIVSRSVNVRQADPYTTWTYTEASSREVIARQADPYVAWTYAEASSREVNARQADPYVAWTYAAANSRGVNVRQADPYVPWAYHEAFTRLLHSYSDWTAAAPAVVDVPLVFAFHPPTPNPARGGALLRFDLPVARKVTVDVLDVMGRRVRVLADRAPYAPGRYSLRLEKGRLPSGLYFVRLNAGEFGQTRRLVVLD